ncbi:MAG: octaprenyl-diphosphate synthase [Desulforhopalus sp.]|jgi:octaprenyl-diphosphate synthase
MNDLLEIVKKEAAEIDRYMHMDLESMERDIDPLLKSVLHYGLFNGGKRIRPLLVVACARLCGMRSDNSYRLGIAFEYLHAATLFHDDIIDGSDTRRGKPAVHKKFDIVAAILAGDFLHAHSMAMVSELAGSLSLACFCKATKGMVDGEFMQLQNAQKHNLSEIDYYNVIMGKTGLLISAACEVGAIFSGADKKEITALRSYGRNLGCAFQIIDDILDYLGDSEKTGKAVGNDFAEGKMTLPLILAMNKATGTDKATLMGMKSGSEKVSIHNIIDIIEKYEGFSGARAHAEKAIKTAFTELEIFTDSSVSFERNLLQALGYFVLNRDK